MSNTSQSPALQNEGAFKKFFRATEIDPRMLGMIGALILIWCIFDIASGILRGNFGGLLGGSFLTPRNLWNLLNQTASIAVMSTGMVLVIVLRQIDLSIGSMLTLIAIAGGVLQVFYLAPLLTVGHPAIWIIAVIFIALLGALVGAFNGYLTAYAQIPAFIVTLGGLIAYRGFGYLLAKGETIAPMDNTFQILGGNIPASWITPFWSWCLALFVCAAIVFGIINSRRQRVRFNFPLRPIWAETTIAAIGSAAVLGATLVVNSYAWPPKLAEAYAKAHGITIPLGIENRDGEAICSAADKIVRCTEGFILYTGYTIPALIAFLTVIVMTFVATRTQFGRYIYATGGNPEAANLAGINTRLLVVKVFSLMGFLVGIGAVIAAARGNSATNKLGELNELYVIAATVIGGTSLAGGVGTIYGAVIGALMMQSIQSGMGLLNLPAAFQDIVVGAVLVVAVWLDQVYRRRAN
jgi:D-xylose transport system permease protein